MMYLQGAGVSASDDGALKWLWRAAEQEYPQAAKTIDYLLNNDFGYGC